MTTCCNFLLKKLYKLTDLIIVKAVSNFIIKELVNVTCIYHQKWQRNIGWFEKKKLTPFYKEGSTVLRLQSQYDDTVLTTKSLAVSLTHLTDFRRMDGWFHLGATKCCVVCVCVFFCFFLSRTPWLWIQHPSQTNILISICSCIYF